jgi:hypothetical protein
MSLGEEDGHQRRRKTHHNQRQSSKHHFSPSMSLGKEDGHPRRMTNLYPSKPLQENQLEIRKSKFPLNLTYFLNFFYDLCSIFSIF